MRAGRYADTRRMHGFAVHAYLDTTVVHRDRLVSGVRDGLAAEDVAFGHVAAAAPCTVWLRLRRKDALRFRLYVRVNVRYVRQKQVRSGVA